MDRSLRCSSGSPEMGKEVMGKGTLPCPWAWCRPSPAGSSLQSPSPCPSCFPWSLVNVILPPLPFNLLAV